VHSIIMSDHREFYHIDTFLIPPSVSVSLSQLSSTMSRLLSVHGVAQSYAWGRKGDKSGVAQLMAAAAAAAAQTDEAEKTENAATSSTSSSSFTIDATKPYAELWLGTHPNGPASVAPIRTHASTATAASSTSSPSSRTTLLAHLNNQPLPFLLKYLSVAQALSIQAHPDEELANKLHQERPDVYKDPHHKPELACAVTPFEALCSFRPLSEWAQHARDYPEMSALIGEEGTKALLNAADKEKQGQLNDDERKVVLRSAFNALMTPSPELLKQQLSSLIERLQKAGIKPSIPACEQQDGSSSSSSPSTVSRLDVPSLILRLHDEYPGDVGVFAPLYLNALCLPPGSALFLGPNDPHAYLSGECVECMAASDNVVRAGLTPKLRDTQVLIDMLTYQARTAEQTTMERNVIQDSDASSIFQFAPPAVFKEFRLRQILAKQSGASITLPSVSGHSILLLTAGAAKVEGEGEAERLTLKRGQAVLVPNQTKLTLTDAGEAQRLAAFQCGQNIQE